METQPDLLGTVLKNITPQESKPKRGASKQASSSTSLAVPTSSSTKWPQPVRRPAPVNLRRASWEGVKGQLKTAIRETVETNCWPLMIYGDPGTGKSCASACIYRMWNPVAYWYRLEHFVRDIHICRTSDRKAVRHIVNGESVYRSESKLWEFVENERALWCIDDVGTRSATESAFDIIFDLIDKRAGLPMILTSNLGLEGLAKVFDSRIADRINAGTIVNLTGESRRAGKKYKV